MKRLLLCAFAAVALVAIKFSAAPAAAASGRRRPAHATECFGSRLLPAVGYTVEPSYFVGPGKIEGIPRLHLVSDFVKRDGSFARAVPTARFAGTGVSAEPCVVAG
jgi:hypothetical protein